MRGKEFKLILRRNFQFQSMCLLAMASAVAITEYVYNTPNPTEQIELPAMQSEADQELDASEVENEVKKDMSEITDALDEPVEPDQSHLPKLEVSEENSEPFSESNEYTAVIQRGDTLASVLGNLGFDKAEVYLASKSLSKVYNLKSIKEGQEILIRGKKDESGDLVLEGLEIRPSYRYRITVSKTDSGYRAEKHEVSVKKIVRSISGTMAPKTPDFSLKQCGVKTCIAVDAIRALNQAVNVKSANGSVDFEFLYSDMYDEDGNVVGKSELLYASAIVNGKIYRVYKFQDGNASEYIDSNGVMLSTISKSKPLLKQPLSRMKVTSKFGVRRHPVTGMIKGHTGVDLSASIGTPVYATASGYVTRASRYSGYGKYVKIKHNQNISTAYAHLSRIVIKDGQYVRQGQIIGYTGNSGVSTGPHLHYEVIKNGVQINPLTYIKQEPQKLSGNRLKKFNQFKKSLSLQMVGLSPKSNATRG